MGSESTGRPAGGVGDPAEPAALDCEPEERRRRAGDVLRWVADGSLSIRIDRRYLLKQARAAHEALEGRATTGKLLLIP